MMTPFTFGVELKFHFAKLRTKETPDPDLDDPRLVKCLEYPQDLTEVKNALHKAGVPTAVVTYQFASEYWSRGYWVVEKEKERELIAPDQVYNWTSIEVLSPPFTFGPEGLDQVRLVCATLSSSLRLHVSESCSVHVHVGHGADGFAFPVVRSLMAFLWCFEPALSDLHPLSHRDSSSHLSLRGSSRLASDYYSAHARDIPVSHALRYIAHAKDIVPLYQRMHTVSDAAPDGRVLAMSDRMAYSLAHLARDASSTPSPPSPHATPPAPKRTLEFRQHEGTLDGPRVVAWIATVVGLINFVETTDAVLLDKLLATHAASQDAGHPLPPVPNLFRSIGLPQSATYYATWLALRDGVPVPASPPASRVPAPFVPLQPFVSLFSL